MATMLNDNWQPIETVPLNQWVLLWDGAGVSTAYFAQLPKFPEPGCRGNTHWAPIPAPPSVKGESDDAE